VPGRMKAFKCAAPRFKAELKPLSLFLTPTCSCARSRARTPCPRKMTSWPSLSWPAARGRPSWQSLGLQCIQKLVAHKLPWGPPQSVLSFEY